MATGLPPDTDADIARVTETLAMITPRWHVRIMVALVGPPRRYSEIAGRMPWLLPGQLHPRLRALCHAGLVERTEHTARHVTYSHSQRGAALLAALPPIATWAEQHLEPADRPISPVEQVEDGLTLLARRHATAILWALRARGPSSGPTLARTVMPGRDATAIYPPMRQLADDGLVDTAGIRQPYRLSAAGEDLGLVFGAMSAWSAGKPLAHAAHHPLWGQPRPGAASRERVSRQTRMPAPTTTPPPTRSGQRTTLLWRHRELFSHPTTTPHKASLLAGGPRR